MTVLGERTDAGGLLTVLVHLDEERWIDPESLAARAPEGEDAPAVAEDLLAVADEGGRVPDPLAVGRYTFTEDVPEQLVRDTVRMMARRDAARLAGRGRIFADREKL